METRFKCKHLCLHPAGKPSVLVAIPVSTRSRCMQIWHCTLEFLPFLFEQPPSVYRWEGIIKEVFAHPGVWPPVNLNSVALTLQTLQAWQVRRWNMLFEKLFSKFGITVRQAPCFQYMKWEILLSYCFQIQLGIYEAHEILSQLS